VTRVVAGVDVGGSKTLAAVADEDGRILGTGSAGGGNRQMVGAAGFRAAVDAAVEAALAAAGAESGDLVGLHVGAAGLDFPEDGVELTDALAGYRGAVVENDALLGLHAGTSSGWGGVVIGGSGTNAAARAPDGTTVFVGGMGWHAGDSGGASMLGVEAQRLAIRSWEGREPPTRLTAALVGLMAATDMAEVFKRVSTFDRVPDPLDVAPLVAAAARDGDEPSAALLAAHGKELGLAVGTALRRLELHDRAPEVVGLGGMFPMCDGTGLFAAMQAEVQVHAPGASVSVLGTEPVVGAVVAALRHAGHEPDVAALRTQWVESWAAR
jgi:N-acetylglucosamine kinase-like BadF-type ATPase